MRIISGSARGTKLYTLEGLDTRPTLDRVKEPLFSIIQHYIPDAIILDLFAGSGALGLEALSRGAQKAILCDNSRRAVSVIKQNIEKTKFNEKTELWNLGYKQSLEKCRQNKICFDIIFLDPPYAKDFLMNSIQMIIEYSLLKNNGIIIAETDEDKQIVKLKQIGVNIYDIRQYGRVKLIFIDKRGK